MHHREGDGPHAPRGRLRNARGRVARLAAVVAGLVLVTAAGLGWARSTDEVSPPISVPVPAQTLNVDEGERAAVHARGLGLVTPPAQRDPAPPIDLQTASFADGSPFHLDKERGHLVVIFFMAYWCPTCVPEAQALAEIQREYGDRGVRILSLDVDQASNEQLLAQFRDRAGGQYLWGIDRGFRVARALGVQMLDSTVVIDREGRVAYRDGSPTPRETLRAVVETLLAEPQR